jgi:hypothetical protein
MKKGGLNIMIEDSRKLTNKEKSRYATSVASKSNSNVTRKKTIDTVKAEVTTKLDETKLDNQIRKRAYAIWESEGRVHGKDVEIWFRAKKEILAQLKKSS